MKIISHRGNIEGANPALENVPSQIEHVLSLGYDCEVDVWAKDESIYLGHDSPEHLIDLNFLKTHRLWCHAKNLEALDLLLQKKLNCFWHQGDNHTVTSTGYIWTFPYSNLTNNCIVVHLPKTWKDIQYKCFAVCTDYI